MLALPRGGPKPHRGFSSPPSDSLPLQFQKENHPCWVVSFLELVMGVSAQSAGNLPFGRRSLLLALPRPWKTVHRTVFYSRLRLPSTMIPKRKPPLLGGFLFGAGDGSLRAICGELALRAAFPLACATQAAENCPPDSFLLAAPTPFHYNSKKETTPVGWFPFWSW